LEQLLNWDLEEKLQKKSQRELFVDISDEEKTIIDYLSEHPDSLIDKIAIDCNIPMSKLSAQLLNMEFKGLIRCMPGKLFRNELL
jgi:DNA processing protein